MPIQHEHDQLAVAVEKCWRIALLDKDARFGFIMHAVNHAFRCRALWALQRMCEEIEDLGFPEDTRPRVSMGPEAALFQALDACKDIVLPVAHECPAMDSVVAITQYLFLLLHARDTKRLKALADLVAQQGGEASFSALSARVGPMRDATTH